MSVAIYANQKMLYSGSIPDEPAFSLHGAEIEESLNKSGKATLAVPRSNALYDCFVPLNTLVEIYKKGVLRWRGRSLVPEMDVYGRKKIVCEGEMGFLQDSTQRPGTVSGTPAEVFSALIQRHNERVEGWKQFTVGVVSVHSDVALELKTAAGEKTYAAVLRLLQLCGGYILFDTLDGVRRINWYADLPYSCNQPVRYGFNLMDFSSSGNTVGFATRIVPYGAEDEKGNRLQISVDGKDYVENAEEVARRGIVEASVIYEGVTDPEELARLAELDVSSSSIIPETIKLLAVDMAQQNLTLDSFRVGQKVPAESELHGLVGKYDLVSLKEDLLDPNAGGITLTRTAAYLDRGTVPLTEAISKQQQQEKKTSAGYLAMVGAITQTILGAKGGAVRLLDLDGDNLPDTLFIADNPDPEKAVKVWRFNYEGWGASETGFDGPFIMGATLEHGILAEAITAANLVAGTIQSADGGRTLFIDLDNGLFDLTGKYRVFSIDESNARVLGGYMGYMEGATEDGTTKGIGVCNEDGSIYIIVTTAGIRLQVGGYYLYINREGKAASNADWTIRGNLTVTGTITSQTG